MGNTAIKYALFEANECSYIQSATIASTDEIENFYHWINNQSEAHCIISTVLEKEKTEEIVSNISKHKPLFLTSDLPLPILMGYTTPETLGPDRLANAVGAFDRFPNQNSLIIDMGTCLKFDYITDENKYLGGAISPGLSMRFKALHTFTGKLPLINQYKPTEIIGSTTKESITSGCLNGMIAEIKQTIQEYKKMFGNINTLLTGGDLTYFEKVEFSQKNTIFADPLLTLRGLNKIADYNATI